MYEEVRVHIVATAAATGWHKACVPARARPLRLAVLHNEYEHDFQTRPHKLPRLAGSLQPLWHVAQGLVQAVGVSNYGPQQMQRIHR